ncbi:MULTISPECIES: ABC transporter substrate-binding protein [unclassified Paenibacillus]|uniref:taurine ABC transporter substrate-binding protein n=1 Tax=unclassified Paenibacillus TaxID=185978 RepID=UPI0024055E40|nr:MULTISPECIES: ABC transporter substrate-binding protein [unclassified Paenibacillus]MDF9841553.1 taurine transport system substrate-binding protein [Paenibacillus sp. PastF-2]MDF9848335.1 taurine transport system substrate-binding protein [Paenibacillus sp. PastM-2]MDF9854712.1 taurine transport system substrate-binding protein [Paenibacillus sp. PastF-1]MDH6479982.1 taurine transport system substrate-binding protein [Paenibacillus sp. PastH-2]MDH6507416.1 taurine transport system substrate
MRHFRTLFRITPLLAVLAVLLVITACGNNNQASGKNAAQATETPAGTAAAETAAAEPAAAAEELPKEIRIGYQVSPNGELLAKALGLLEKKYPDITVSWLKFDSGRDVNVAIASGGIDFGLLGTPPGASGIAQGLPDQVYYIHDVIGQSEALVVKSDSGIASLADLKGHTIATTFGSTSHFSLLSALKQENIDPATLTILDMQAPDIVAAWQRGDIEGAYTWQPSQSKLVEDGGKIIISSAEVAAKGGITGEFGVVHNDFIAKYPHVVKGYISVLDEAVKLYRDQPQESAEALSAELGLTPEATLKAMNEIIVLDASQQTAPEYMGTPDQPGAFGQLLKDTADFLVEQKSITESPELSVYQKALRNDLYSAE